MEHRLTDSNLIISRSDLNALKNVLVDKIHEKSTLIVQSMMVSIYRLRHKTSRFFSGAYIFINSE